MFLSDTNTHAHARVSVRRNQFKKSKASVSEANIRQRKEWRGVLRPKCSKSFDNSLRQSRRRHNLLLLCAAHFHDVGDHDSPQPFGIKQCLPPYCPVLFMFCHPFKPVDSQLPSCRQCPVSVKFSTPPFLIMYLSEM